MSLKNVLRTYSLLRSLTDDESALLETLRGLSESDREQLVESLSPSGAGKKKAGKKSGSKSLRASGMAKAIGDNLRQKRSAALPNDPADPDYDPSQQCQKEFDGGFICNEPADANVHHLRGATGYHEFVGGQAKTMAASTSNDATPAPSGE
jgi:hypothetical protein